MRTLQDTFMKRRQAKKRPKPPSKKKVTGTVVNLTPNQIALATDKGVVWGIKRTPRPKVSGTLRKGSRVTVEFNKNDGKILGRMQPGKRTETGTVTGLTASHIRLDNTTPDAGPWDITRTQATAVLSGALTVGSTAMITSNDADWQLILA
jgi:hypothetical protein